MQELKVYTTLDRLQGNCNSTKYKLLLSSAKVLIIFTIYISSVIVLNYILTDYQLYTFFPALIINTGLSVVFIIIIVNPIYCMLTLYKNYTMLMRQYASLYIKYNIIDKIKG